jgi:hypothetical protein
MTAGMPGAGLGSVFYLISAIAMPFRELAGALLRPNESRRWELAIRQAALAGCVMGGMWITGLVVGNLIAHSVATPTTATTLLARVRSVSGSENVVRFAAFVLSISTLVAVWTSVHIARLVLEYRTRQHARHLRLLRLRQQIVESCDSLVVDIAPIPEHAARIAARRSRPKYPLPYDDELEQPRASA